MSEALSYWLSFAGVIALGAILFSLMILLIRALRKPVTFRGFDEQMDVYNAAQLAARELGLAPRELRYALSLWVNEHYFNWMGSIPVSELAILAPFIDRIIDGKGPPLNLPLEIEDTRPNTLARFKERMKGEGLWPRSKVEDHAPGQLKNPR